MENKEQLKQNLVEAAAAYEAAREVLIAATKQYFKETKETGFFYDLYLNDTLQVFTENGVTYAKRKNGVSYDMDNDRYVAAGLNEAEF